MHLNEAVTRVDILVFLVFLVASLASQTDSVAHWRFFGNKGQQFCALRVAVLATTRVFPAHGRMNDGKHGIGFGWCKAKIEFLGFEVVQPFPAIRPVVEIECVAIATTPYTKGLFVPFITGNCNRTEIGKATLAGKAGFRACTDATPLDDLIGPIWRWMRALAYLMAYSMPQARPKGEPIRVKFRRFLDARLARWR